LDRLDKALIIELAQNCRVYYAALARKHQVTLNSIKNRINKLLAQGLIQQFTVQLSPRLFHASGAYILFANTKTVTSTLLNQIGNHPNVRATGTGPDKGVLFALYPSNDQLNQLLDQLHQYGLEEIQVLTYLELDRAPPSKSLPTLETLQPLDYLILYHLRVNGRMKLGVLAQKIRVSVPTIRKRLNFLRVNRYIEETIIMNLGASSGVMALFIIEFSELTTRKALELTQRLHQGLHDQLLLTWKSVERPQLLVGFYFDGAYELTRIKDQIQNDLIPECLSINHAIGGSMTFYPDFRDDFLEAQKQTGRFSPELWYRGI